MDNITNNIGTIIFFVIIIGLGILILWFFIFKCKHLKTPDVYMVDGGVKTGKSLVCVMLAVKQYRKNLIKFYIKKPFIKMINAYRTKHQNKKLIKLEKPMLYSNMPLYHVKYNPLTMEIMKMQVRIPHKSVVLIDEATIIADSLSSLNMSKDKKVKEIIDEINETLTLFIKLFGHSTHGGSLFYNSQQVIDLHFAFKRNTSTYLMVMKNRKFPFFCLLDVKELVHDESGDVVNTQIKDIDEDSKPLFVSKRFFKYYDRYYLDVLTKHLPTQVNYNVEKLSHKDKKELDLILSLGNYKKIKEYNERKQKELANEKA